MTDNAIIREYDDHYQEAFYAWNPFYPLADRDLRYYLGDQWDEKEKQKLFEEGRNALVFNYIRRNINLLTGYQRKNRSSSVVIPIENSDQQTADQLSKLLLYALNYGDGYKFISEAFAGSAKTGFNLLEIWMDYRDDPINGDIKFGRSPYNGFITDPYFTQLDFSDCSYVIKRKYLAASQAASLLPGQEKDVYELARKGWSRDDKFTWLPFQRQPNGEDFVAYNEYHRPGWKTVSVVVDEETGEFTEWEGSKEGLQYYLKSYPQLKEVKRPKRYMDCHIIVNDHFMRTERNRYGLDEYPFVPMVGVFESESELWDIKMQSLIRCQIDPQRESNRRRSQMIDIVDSGINSGWIASKNDVVNPRSLFQTSQGKVIWKQDGVEPGSIEKIQPAQIPQGMFALQQQFDKDIMTIMGINDANFGVTENPQESGISMMIRQSASIVNLQDVFDNLRYAQKLISKKALKMIIGDPSKNKEGVIKNRGWNEKKMARILNEKPTPQLKSKEILKYDVSVQEGVLTDSQRQIYFRQMVDLYQLTGANQGSPITPQMLIKAAPLQGKSELNQELEQNQKAQQQQAQKQEQIAMQKLQSELEYNKAASIEKIAGSKERFTRSVANMGLEDERAARAVDDRASAALERIKAIKELSTMDDDKIMKYAQMINMMEEKSKREEEQMKSDDVTISAQGGQTSAPTVQTQPSEG